MGKTRKWIIAGGIAVAALFMVVYVLDLDAYARAGGGRSMGSRGSRSSYSASRSATTSPSRSLTSPAPTAPKPAPHTLPQQSGGFWRTFAGGLAGGLLGSLLFSSLGFGHGGGFGGGGIGLLDIILLGLILYFAYRFFKKRKAQTATAGSYYEASGTAVQPSYGPAYAPRDEVEEDRRRGLAYIKQMDPSFDEGSFNDQCMDIFFKIQGAWANRDMTVARSYLTEEMFTILDGEAQKMKAEKKINRLENIAVRSVDIVEAWQEQGQDFITVRFLANLLDYTMDEKGELLAGSKTEPVKFEEFWTFTRPVGPNPWRLSAIDQAE